MAMGAFVLLFALLAWSDPSWAQEEPRDLSEEAAAAIEGKPIPALVVGVWQDGKLQGLGVAGVRATNSEVLATTDDIWHLGSCTKAMTATLCAIAVERGLLRFDETLGEFFGSRGVEVHKAMAPIRLEQLLDHTSGLIAHHAGLWARYYKDVRPRREVRRDVAKALLRSPPEAPPGTRYEYSNFGYLLIGTVLEEAFDLDFEALMQRELFAPLGLTSAGFGPPGRAQAIDQTVDKPVDQPRGHRLRGQELVPVPPGPAADNPPWFSPAGTAHMSIGDWGKFLGFQLGDQQRADGLESPILKLESLERLHHPTSGFDYALGWQIAKRGFGGGPTLQHTGSNTMWFSSCALSPANDLAVFAVANTAGKQAEQACAELLRQVARDQLTRSRQSNR